MATRFEIVSEYKDKEIKLPERKTKFSAGYDFEVAETTVIPSAFFELITTFLNHNATEERLKLLSENPVLEELVTGSLNPQNPEDIKELLLKILPELIDYNTFDLTKIKNILKENKTKITLVPTGIKAKMDNNQVLKLFIRSSTPLNSYLVLANGVGIIDADYYNNPDNEGHIYFQILNLSPFQIILNKGDTIGQGIFERYEITEDDNAQGERLGGYGSTSAE